MLLIGSSRIDDISFGFNVLKVVITSTGNSRERSFQIRLNDVVQISIDFIRLRIAGDESVKVWENGFEAIQSAFDGGPSHQFGNIVDGSACEVREVVLVLFLCAVVDDFFFE